MTTTIDISRVRPELRHILETCCAAQDAAEHDEVPSWLSTGEFLAAALVLNRPDWLVFRNYTIVEALKRVISGGWDLPKLIEVEKVLSEAAFFDHES